MNIFLYILTWFFYRTINRRRDRIWNSMTVQVSKNSLSPLAPTQLRALSCSFQEQQEYLKTTTDAGNQRLNFRFSY